MSCSINTLYLYLLCSCKKSRYELLNWMLDHNQTKDGKIVFYRRDAMSKLQEVLFKKAFCIKYKEHFDAQGTEPLQIEIRLIAQGFDVGGVAHNKMWRG